jgi:squalene-hopene/tetraprenyl-beta-curcumene cyclase
MSTGPRQTRWAPALRGSEATYGRPQERDLRDRPTPAEYGDPAIADVVGRVLWGLGEFGLTVDDPTVAGAVRFLERDACEDGAWWGIWNPAYVSGTAFALLGLAKVGADMRAPFIDRATKWLLSVQNEDGGFGERPSSFLDPSQRGVGPSHPSLTGIALRALAELAAHRVGGVSVKRAGDLAAKYLMNTQLADGSL